MADSSKRTEVVKVCIDEQMLLDFSRDAIHADRSLSDFIYLVLRNWKYGQGEGSARSKEGQEVDRDGH